MKVLLRRRRTGTVLLIVTLATVLLRPYARAADPNPNQFGGQDRANAASEMIVLAVQQGISSLPPTSAQSFTYDFDPKLGTFVPSNRLGPISFRSTETIGKGKFSLRVAGSYFELSDSFGPVTYFIEPENSDLSQPTGFAQFGLKVDAQVGVVNYSASYGLLDRIELMLNVPMVIVDASAKQSFSTRPENLDAPANEAVLSGGATQEELDAALSSGDLVFRTESFSDLGFEFNDGAHVGVGRISLGAKGVFLTEDWLQAAFSTELFFPSPNEDEFSGSESTAILPRLIVQVPVNESVRLHADAGYDYDFDKSQLRRFVFDAGFSVPFEWITFDFGVGGSFYDTPIRWSPNTARGDESEDFAATVLTVQNDTSVDEDFVEFLGGFKVKLTDNLVFGGGVIVPFVDSGFRPAATGTGVFEWYF